ncbi:cysteine desulfurase family protein [Flavobacterium sp. J27]|uniref:cysteine desulfurase family protein n=1 Tax=Flavobacterium sp. J27 TaxID=2060419 RepID=UPI0010315464|nr:cysteine desulfurase family protein [Flavobacterium sp. J27]
MKKVYFDNAATTALREEVIHEMTSVLIENFGNPSSTHSFGRNAKNILESSRKIIAKHLYALASEIIFTSSATEATNWILRSAVKDLGVKHIITSKIEHHATLHTVLVLEKEYNVKVSYLPILEDGNLDIAFLNGFLEDDEKTIVSLMHVNNETGEILPIDQVSKICQEKKAYFHCDAVQSIGKMPLDVNLLGADFIVGTAHKFHGPKGIGFAYIKKNTILQPLLYGGEQEKGFRAGTEAVHQVSGMAKALELAYINLNEERAYIESLKKYCTESLKKAFPDSKIIGLNTFYNMMNVVLPLDPNKTAMLLFSLDMKGIAVSRGSACQSGSNKPSHVLAAFLSPEEQLKPNIRISFSHWNTKEEIDYLVEVLQTI